MTKAVIFDMYETLITLWHDTPYNGKQIAEDIGISESVFRLIWDDTEDDRTLGLRTFEDVIEEILRANNCYSDELFDKIVRKRKASKTDAFDNLHPNVVPMLKELKLRGYKIGLITNCFSEEQEVIMLSELFQYFDVAIMSCEIGLKKPDRRIFELCVDKLEVDAHECLYCGDGGSDELAVAKEMGMKPIQALWYLKEGSGQPVGRLDEFEGCENPMDIITII